VQRRQFSIFKINLNGFIKAVFLRPGVPYCDKDFIGHHISEYLDNESFHNLISVIKKTLKKDVPQCVQIFFIGYQKRYHVNLRPSGSYVIAFIREKVAKGEY
jgi:hypothetical protein